MQKWPPEQRLRKERLGQCERLWTLMGTKGSEESVKQSGNYNTPDNSFYKADFKKYPVVCVCVANQVCPGTC